MKNSIHMGTFTGLRVYPWAVGEGQGLKPYLGYKVSPWRYRQGDTPELSYKTTRIKGMVDAGLGWATSWGYFTLEGTKLLNPDFKVNLTPAAGSTPDRWPGWTIGMGLNISLETTSVASNPVNKQLNTELREHNQQGLFLAAGASSAFPIAASDAVTEDYPYLDDRSFPTIFPDLALGYHFTKADALVAVSRRRMVQRRSAYNRALDIDRQSTVEAYKFVGDYHGFVPYVGLGVGMERMDLEEREGRRRVGRILRRDAVVPRVWLGHPSKRTWRLSGCCGPICASHLSLNWTTTTTPGACNTLSSTSSSSWSIPSAGSARGTSPRQGNSDLPSFEAIKRRF